MSTVLCQRQDSSQDGSGSNIGGGIIIGQGSSGVGGGGSVGGGSKNVSFFFPENIEGKETDLKQ